MNTFGFGTIFWIKQAIFHCFVPLSINKGNKQQNNQLNENIIGFVAALRHTMSLAILHIAVSFSALHHHDGMCASCGN